MDVCVPRIRAFPRPVSTSAFQFFFSLFSHPPSQMVTESHWLVSVFLPTRVHIFIFLTVMACL